MASTTNYGWTTPDDTSLVKDGAAAIRSLGTAIDTTVFANASAGIPKTIVDAKGDLIAATAADTVSRLAVGTNGQVLTADSAEATGIKWATSASGGMTLISTTTLSGTSVTLSSIPSTYKKIYVVISGATWGTATSNFQLYPNSLSTQYAVINRNPNAAAENVSMGNMAIMTRTAWLNTGGNNAQVLEIDNYASASYFKAFRYWGYCEIAGSNGNAWQIAGGVRTTSAISSLYISTENAYSFSAGQVLLYGVN